MGFFDMFGKKENPERKSLIRNDPVYKEEAERRTKKDTELEARLLAREEFRPSPFDIQRRAFTKRKIELEESIARRTGKRKAEGYMASRPSAIAGRLGKTAAGVGKETIRRAYGFATSIHPQKRTKKSLRGLFNKDAFITQVRK